MAQQQTTVIALVKFRRDCLHWGIPQLALRRYFIPEVPGLIFFKVLGSGYNGGFGMLPGLNYQGLCFHFDEEENAQNFLNHSNLLKQYELRSDEFFVSVLVPYDSRGSWSGEKITVHEKAKNFALNKEPIASLTRASIRIRKMISFWSHTPETEGALSDVQGCMLSVGLGEAPLLRQATFTIWENLQSLELYSKNGAHLDALRKAYQGNYFSESMFVRFRAKSMRGTWKGKNFD